MARGVIWIKDPADRPDNRRVALAMLYSTERRLGKNTQHANVYDNQVRDNGPTRGRLLTHQRRT